MIQNITQNITSFIQEHPIKFAASTLGGLVALECALCALKNAYGYATEKNDYLKSKHWEDLKVDLGGAATYGILASNYLAPYTGMIGSAMFMVYAFYKVELQGCKREDVYRMTWAVGNTPRRIWNVVGDVFTYIGRVFQQKPIVVLGLILTALVVVKMGAIPAAARFFANIFRS